MFSLLLLKNAAGTCHWQNDSAAGNYLEQHEKGKCISIQWNLANWDYQWVTRSTQLYLSLSPAISFQMFQALRFYSCD